ncbi:MAG: glycosyltransferase family 39 protein [Xanthomonadales bacterium]|nr:glycosyltransferase family 39 protein [Xanthomonadales bacterium]
MNRQLRTHLLLLLGLGLVYIATGIGLRDPWPSDEPRFALIAKDMVESGEWFFPRRGGELYPDKPPLFMWAQAIFYQLTGSLRIAALLPSLLAGLAVLVLIYDMGRRLWNPRVGLAAGLLLLVAPQFVLEARAGQLDAMVTAWIALGMYGFLRHLLLGPDRRWLLVGFAACGFGIITKGVGFLPLLVFLPFLFYRRRAPDHVAGGTGARDALTGVLVMLAAIGLWLIPMLLLVSGADDPAYAAYRDNILFKQTGERYVAPSHHFKPWWYFLVEVIPALWLPIFLLLPWLVPNWFRAIRENDGRIILLLGFVALTVLFFTLSPAKRGVYILPALPWCALAAAPWLEEILARRAVQRIGFIVSGVLGLTALAGAAFLTWFDPAYAQTLTERYAFDPTAALWLFFAGISLAIIVGILRRSGPLAYAATIGSLWIVLGLWVYPRLDAFKSGRALLERAESELATGQPLALVDWKEQTLLQAQRPAVNFGFLVPAEEQSRRAVAWLRQHPNGRILIRDRSLSPCFNRGEPVDLGTAHRRDWYLVGPDNINPDCG